MNGPDQHLEVDHGGRTRPFQFRAASLPLAGDLVGDLAKRLDVPLEPLQQPQDAATKISYELAFGEHSPYSRTFPALTTLPYRQQQAITRDVLNRITDVALQELGGTAVQRLYGPGGWQHYPVAPSAQTDVQAHPETLRDLMAGIGLLAQQSGVFASRPHPEGDTHALEIVEAPGGTVFHQPKKVEAFWRTLIAQEPRLAEGFLPVRHGDQRGLRIVNSGDYRWSPHDYAAFGDALGAAADAHGVRLDQGDPFRGRAPLTGFLKVHTLYEGNDWGEHPNGEAYQARLAGRQPSGVFGRLLGPHRDAVTGWLADAYRRHAGWSPQPLPGIEQGAGLPQDPAEHFLRPDSLKSLFPDPAEEHWADLWAFEHAALQGLPTDALFEKALRYQPRPLQKGGKGKDATAKVQAELERLGKPEDGAHAAYLVNAAIGAVAEALGMQPTVVRAALDPKLLPAYHGVHGVEPLPEHVHADDASWARYPWESKSEDPYYYGDGRGGDDPYYYGSMPADTLSGGDWDHAMTGLGPQEHRQHLKQHQRELKELQKLLAKTGDPEERQLLAELLRQIARHYRDHLQAKSYADPASRVTASA